jgi:tyrosyl-tRNA synthetase
MTPLLEGTDGEKKMSKSLGNYIGINEPPQDIVGKVMSISDELMLRYYEVLTSRDLAEVRAQHPKAAKLALAEEVVAQFYDGAKAREACAEFERVFSQKQLPDDMPEYHLPSENSPPLTEVLIHSGLAASRNEVRRLLQQGAVTREGEKISDENWPVRKGVLKIGKRRFLKII